jgi:MFS family permease
MPDPHIQQPASSTDLAGSRRYRFWPVYATAFTRTLSYTIYGVSLPNYLISFLRVPGWLYGVIISVYAIAYIAGPLVATPITRRIGARNGIIFSVMGSIILVSFQLVLLDPMALIFLRAIDGFILGFFWPNLQMELSSWQREIPEKNDGQFFQTYGMSWNAGIIIADLGGFLIVFIGAGNEYLALVISWLVMISMLPCALAMEKTGTGIIQRGTTYIAIAASQVPRKSTEAKGNHDSAALKSNDGSLHRQDTSSHPLSTNTKYLLSFPAIFYLVGTLIYAYIKGFYPTVYPLALKAAGIPLYVVYLVTFIHQALQAVIIAIWTRKGVRLNHSTWVAAMAINVAFFIWLWLAGEPILLTIAFAVNGILSGWLYTFTSKIMLEYGAVENSLKYATYYEFFNGIGFGVAPLIAGAAPSIDPSLNYAFMTLLVAAFCVLLFIGSARAAAKRKSTP